MYRGCLAHGVMAGCKALQVGDNRVRHFRHALHHEAALRVCTVSSFVPFHSQTKSFHAQKADCTTQYLIECELHS